MPPQTNGALAAPVFTMAGVVLVVLVLWLRKRYGNTAWGIPRDKLL